ncbi:helix-turn-helix domain-containing protein [Photorhabdus cinerea]|uniref:Transcriptional regulator n=1 Tax=Photorhabdus cinerea TaxID=471575 RepID=A0A7X5QGG5_9GAMM|nr:helix-turn-helix transcriptional regulator [Photorhabdus cinerea]NHB93897.1 transcriptional regulator [Photorhabdus cinerea]
MKTHTDEVQIIRQGNKPVFAVLPYDHYLELAGREKGENVYIPHEVVGLQVKKGLSLIAAWRTYKGISQQQLADKLGISQPAIAQIEKVGANTQPKTLQKVADALGISFEQVIE